MRVFHIAQLGVVGAEVLGARGRLLTAWPRRHVAVAEDASLNRSHHLGDTLGAGVVCTGAQQQ